MSPVTIKKPNSPLVPVAVASVLAILGIVGFLFVLKTPPSTTDSGESMISAAAISRVGATEVLSYPATAAQHQATIRSSRPVASAELIE